MSDVFSINEIALLNNNNLSNKDLPNFINYLDTSSINNNKIGELQFLVGDYPSRAKRKVKLNTIIYSTVRPNQEHFGIIENDEIRNFIVSTGFTTIDVNSDKINPKYLYYKITQPSITNYLQSVADNAVSAYPSIKPEDLGKLRFKFPNLSSQQKIAAVLSALDDKIELNNRINAELEALAKSIYDYWFVQFDFPYSPHSEGCPQDGAVGNIIDNTTENLSKVAEPQAAYSKITSLPLAMTGYKSSGGKMVYNETLKREIPEGWEVNTFFDWIAGTKAGDWGKELEEGNYKERVYCVRGADINGLNGLGEIKAPQRFILKNNLSKSLKPNDFIIEISGGSPTQSTARIAQLSARLFERFDSEIICSNFCKAVSLKNEKYAYNFRYEWQRLYDRGIFFGYEGKTSGIKNFLFDSFVNSYQVVMSPKELATKFFEIVNSFEIKKQINLKQNQQLAELRDWLLPMLMNGQVKVGDE